MNNQIILIIVSIIVLLLIFMIYFRHDVNFKLRGGDYLNDNKEKIIAHLKQFNTYSIEGAAEANDYAYTNHSFRMLDDGETLHHTFKPWIIDFDVINEFKVQFETNNPDEMIAALTNIKNHHIKPLMDKIIEQFNIRANKASGGFNKWKKGFKELRNARIIINKTLDVLEKYKSNQKELNDLKYLTDYVNKNHIGM